MDETVPDKWIERKRLKTLMDVVGPMILDGLRMGVATALSMARRMGFYDNIFTQNKPIARALRDDMRGVAALSGLSHDYILAPLDAIIDTPGSI